MAHIKKKILKKNKVSRLEHNRDKCLKIFLFIQGFM